MVFLKFESKDPPIECGVCSRKILDSESPMVGLQQFTMGFVSGENFHLLQRQTKIEEVEFDGAVIY